MLVRAEEARMKWCPFARSAWQEGNAVTTVNRDTMGSFHAKCHCLASNCMAWRWSDKDREKGYCGLAEPPK